ncbi:TorF family putative porin [Akkermansiaceae bacterium]|nr:TorF family putative porin [bacterium]MDB4787846.1 TorF family putative porin [Akkermansiaceae bacterium]
MKKTSTILAIGSALALGSAQAEIESSFHVGYSTDYVWRGLNQADGSNNGLYEYGLDFTGDCNCGATWNAGIWQADFGDGAEELNIYAGMSKEFGAVELSLGLIRYDYGNGSNADTTELFLGAGTDLGGLDLSAAIYYDVDGADGNMFGELSLGKSFDVGGATLEVAANFGTTLDAGTGDDYVTYGLSASLSKELGDNLTGSLYVAGETTEGVRGNADGDDLYGGISLSYGF